MSAPVLPAQRVVIIDFGSQFTQLIARRVRQLELYCEIVPHTCSTAELASMSPAAIILSGGPASVYDAGAPQVDPTIFELGGSGDAHSQESAHAARPATVPILGICYGQQLLAHALGGRVHAATHREYGHAQVRCHATLPAHVAPMFAQVAHAAPFGVWMSHGDSIEALPQDVVSVAYTPSTPYAAIAHRTRPIVGLQFHPEVSHTPQGMALLAGFLLQVAKLRPNWTMKRFLEDEVAALSQRVGADEQVICALSGGVDSSVVAALLGRALGRRVHCIFVDNGLLRHAERAHVERVFAEALGLPLHVVDASARFAAALAGVTDPEDKRKAIGATFIDVFEEEAARIPGATFLAQGTLYPDVIESVSGGGASHVIKSHHNVGGLPARMRLKLIEPLRALFKDEVRMLGMELGLPRTLCFRHPFPGPGLAVRVLGEVTRARLARLAQADAIVEQEVIAGGLYDSLWQSFAVLLPVRSVGVMGDRRTYDETVAVRCVQSLDGMTADWARLPHDVLAQMSCRIINEVDGVNRVVYDISSKPPATIEWE